jgi:hypothetical protein
MWIKARNITHYSNQIIKNNKASELTEKILKKIIQLKNGKHV